MRTSLLALCLSTIYVLIVPDGLPAWVHLFAGLLCLVTAMAITGSQVFDSVQVGEKILSLMPYFLMASGILSLLRGTMLYVSGPVPVTQGGFEAVSDIDKYLPYIMWLTGVILVFAGVFNLYTNRQSDWKWGKKKPSELDK